MSLYVIGIILCCGLIGAVSASIGLYAVLQKKSLLADSISHSLLPGIMLGFIISGGKNPFWISLCATISGLISAYLTDWIIKKSPIKQDAAIGISLATFFGIGVVLLSYIQNTVDGAQSGLNQLLLGNAASMQNDDLLLFSVLGLLVLLVNALLGKEFKLLCFNPEYAQSIGLPVKSLQFCLRTLTVLTIVAGIQAVGVVLMASCLIVPSIAARYWKKELKPIHNLSVIIGLLSGCLGAFISYRFDQVPTGPLIVIILSLTAFVSLAIGKDKGITLRMWRTRGSEHKIHGEHLLKTIFKILEEKPDHSGHVLLRELRSAASLQRKQYNSGLKWLRDRKFITLYPSNLVVEEIGRKEANRIVRLHRLWELYLLKRLNLPAEHVHENAEQIEHVLSPALEKALLEDLEYPLMDPHNSIIPNE